jgi:5,10-methylenetetrahydromethanopterin reductase
MEKTGIFLESLSLEDTFRFAKMADESGFDSIWLPEITWSDSFSLATAAAMSTKRVKLATGVVGIFSRSPVLMAMSVAGLDELSGGRAILGLGTQARPYVELWHGLKFERPVERMREYVKAVKMILANPFGMTNYGGKIIRVGGFVLTVKPKGTVPVFVAAIGPRMQRVAGEVGDGVLGYFYSVKYVKNVLMPNLKEGAEKAKRSLNVNDFEVAVGIPTLVSDSEDRFEMIKPLVAVFTTATGSSPSYQTILGDLGYSGNVEAVAKKVRDGDIQGAIKHIPDEMAREVTLCGNVSEVRQRIKEYREAGVSLPLMNPTPPYAYYPLFPTHLPDKLGAGSVDYAGLRMQVSSAISLLHA